MAGLCIVKGEKEKLLKELDMFIEDEQKATKEYAKFGKDIFRKFRCNVQMKMGNQAGQIGNALLDNLSMDEHKHAENLKWLREIIEETDECE